MGQMLHGSTKTMRAVRTAIQRSQATLKELAQQYAINPKTVAKWRKRDFIDDVPMGPKPCVVSKICPTRGIIV